MRLAATLRLLLLAIAMLGLASPSGSYAASGSAYSRDYVQKAYVAYYGRPADPGGLNYWATRMDAEGGSLNAIIGAFGNSDEFNRRYGGLSYVALVTKIYQQALGRDPEQGGLDYYVGELQAGRRTLQSITLDVLNGATTAPDLTVVANKLDVAAYYSVAVTGGCPYGTEQDGVSALSGITSVAAAVSAAKAAIDRRCWPTLPPDPGDAGKATVEGIDSNSNGVRDEVERWVEMTYAASPRTKAVVAQMARSQQQIVVVGANGAAAHSAAATDFMAYGCGIYALGFESATNARRLLFSYTMNTKERTDAYLSFNRFSAGKITDPVSGNAISKRSCDGFDPDALRQ